MRATRRRPAALRCAGKKRAVVLALAVALVLRLFYVALSVVRAIINVSMFASVTVSRAPAGPPPKTAASDFQLQRCNVERCTAARRMLHATPDVAQLAVGTPMAEGGQCSAGLVARRTLHDVA